jgi:hypothetical protein
MFPLVDLTLPEPRAISRMERVEGRFESITHDFFPNITLNDNFVLTLRILTDA